MYPKKIDLSHTSVSDEKLAKLRDLLPEVFHEGAINWDELRNALGDYVEEDPRNERFGLRWPGKSRLQQVINTPSVGTLVPLPEESVDWDTTGNVIIEGDNLEVLKLLQKSYAGKVKMIYIDPPYNTGNDFVYPDKYVSGIDTYLEFTGQVDGDGKKVRTNSETSGRYHTDWLNMMYPRLYLARNLLREDGMIFVSIDQHEIENFLKLASEIFGESNVIGKLAVVNNLKGRSDDEFFATANEFLVVVARDETQATVNGLPPTLEYLDEFDKQDSISRYKEVGLRKTGKNSRRVDRPNMFYPIYYSPLVAEFSLYPKASAVEILPLDTSGAEGRWRWGKETFEKNHHTELTAKEVNGRWNVYVKMRDSVDGETRTVRPKSIWLDPRFDTGAGNRAADGALGISLAFQNPKPVELITEALTVTGPEDDYVLDFFAGSGTTAHAVMQHNTRNEGGGQNSKYILVQLPEPMEPKTLDDGTVLNTIADLCRERVRRAGRKIAAENPDLQVDTGFRAYKLAPSNFTPWDGSVADSGLMTSARQTSFMPQSQQLSLEQRILHAADHLNPNASDIAILTELLLKLGEELTVPITELTLAGKSVYDIDNNLRLICLDRYLTLDVIREMAAREPAEIICLDDGFPDDQTKVNAGQIIATQAHHAEGSIAFKVV